MTVYLAILKGEISGVFFSEQDARTAARDFNPGLLPDEVEILAIQVGRIEEVRA